MAIAVPNVSPTQGAVGKNPVVQVIGVIEISRAIPIENEPELVGRLLLDPIDDRARIAAPRIGFMTDKPIAFFDDTQLELPNRIGRLAEILTFP
ncbi:MAG: hypothetical protein AB7E81_00875 [Hyphomicrobiaceae bacterium]